MDLSDATVPIPVRVKHAAAMAKSASGEAIDVLLSGLDSKDETIAKAVRDALRERKCEAELLRRAADASLSDERRVAALAGLRVLKPSAGAAVAALLSDPREAVREAAAFALCVFGEAEAESVLVRALANEASAKVRYFVAVALGHSKSAAAQQAVAERLAREESASVIDALTQAQLLQRR